MPEGPAAKGPSPKEAPIPPDPSAKAALGAVRRRRFTKRSDQVVEQIKRLITETHLKPGDRLPQERALIDLFGVSKGTVREALKGLEVEGLITVTTGPQGGARVAKVPLDTAIRLLDGYFFYEPLTVDDLYGLRRLVEPAVAAEVTPLLTDDDLDTLEANIAFCDPVPRDREGERSQRYAELDFHDVIAERCPNPLLRFACRFINAMIKKGFVYRRIYGQPGERDKIDNMEQMACDGRAAHRALLDAFRARDADRARAVMADHMDQAHAHLKRMEAKLIGGFLGDEYR